jgi:hypothetical protein
MATRSQHRKRDLRGEYALPGQDVSYCATCEKGWKCQYSEGERVLPLPRAEAALSRPADTECPSLRVWLRADVLAIFRCYSDEEIDFEVDLRELQGQERLELFCGFLREIGRRLGKPVLMHPEGAHGHPVLGFDVEADRVVLLAEPRGK